METNKKSAFDKKASEIVNMDQYKDVNIKACEIPEVKAYMDELYDEFRSNLSQNFQSSAFDLQLRAVYDFAFEAHWLKRQLRKSGEFFITHPVSVALIVANEIGMGITPVQAALLHDVVEDTPITSEDIKKSFGATIADIVVGLTKITGVYNAERNGQAETFKKMLLSIPHDARVVFIKLADRIHNMRTMEGMKERTRRIKSNENLYVFVPVADAIGLFDFKHELEDTSFKYLYEDEYNNIVKKVDSFNKNNAALFSQFKLELMRVLVDTGFTCKIVTEPKTYYQIWKEYRIDKPIEDCHCMAARVVFKHQFSNGNRSKSDDVSEYYKIFSSIICKFKERENSRVDYVVRPLDNGFKALIFKVYFAAQSIEVQLIDEDYEIMAHRGITTKGGARGGVADLQDKIKDYDVDKNAEDIIQVIHDQLSQKKIFVFARNGDAKEIPQNSTVLDFAYFIHTDVGNHCIGAYVGNKFVPVDHELQTADHVTVLTSPSARPQHSWMHFVNTDKAKMKIEEYFQRNPTNSLPDVKKGEQMFHKLMYDNKVLSKDVLLLNSLITHFHLSNSDEFFRQIASQEISLEKLWNATESIHRMIRLNKKINGRPSGFTIYKINPKEPFTINKDISFIAADCCHPICGDDAVAFLDKEHILYVHRRDCDAAKKQIACRSSEVTSVLWEGDVEPMLTAIQIKGTDRQGLIRDVSILIDSWRVNIKSFEIGASDNHFTGTIKMMVKNTETLKQLASQLRLITNIVSVNRIGPNNVGEWIPK